MDDLSSKVTTLQRLSRHQLELLRLRCEGRSTSEIAARHETGQRDVMLQLAQIYDTLWLTHLPREERLDALGSYCSAITYMYANDLLPKQEEADGAPQPRIAPPQAAVVAVIADEQQILTNRAAQAALMPEPAEQLPETASASTEDAAALLVPADRDASLVRLALISTAIIAIVVVAVALLFTNTGTSDANTPDSTSEPTQLATTVPAVVASPTDASTATPTEAVTSAASPTRRASSTPATPTRTPTPLTPTATPIPPTPAPNVLYQSDWTSSLTDWTANGNWSVKEGILIYTGGQGSGVIYSPFQPQAGQSYVVEAEVQIDNPTASGAVAGFAIGDPNTPTADPLRVANFWVSDTGWHIYRLTVDGDKATMTVDGQVAGEITDATYAGAGKVGIYTTASRLQARRFTVTDRP